MKEPREELKADADEREDPPDFDLTPASELVRGDRTREDFLDAVLQLDEPATVEAVASLADHGTDAAREYLDWFERMGMVTRVTDTPSTYRVNRDYLVWRRVQQLREDYETAELVDHLDAANDRFQGYAEEFGVDSPDAVSLSEYATATDRSVEDVWKALSDWKTIQRRIRLLERAIASETGNSSGYRSLA